LKCCIFGKNPQDKSTESINQKAPSPIFQTDLLLKNEEFTQIVGLRIIEAQQLLVEIRIKKAEPHDPSIQG
jgi:hypothetical protein